MVGGKGGGTQLLSLEFIEIDLFLLRLRCGRGRPVSGQLRVPYQIDLTHPQYKISPFELSFSVCCSSRVKPIFTKRSSLVLTHDQLLNTVRAV